MVLLNQVLWSAKAVKYILAALMLLMVIYYARFIWFTMKGDFEGGNDY